MWLDNTISNNGSVLVLAAAGNKSATRPPLPLPGCGGEWKETGRKLVGREKGSLREQQTKRTVTETIQKKGNIQNKPAEQNCSLGLNHRCALPSCE